MEDGTVRDNLTGLAWLKNANCIKTDYPEYGDPVHLGRVTWQQALDFVQGMNDGTYHCGGNHTDWRVPNVREMLSLADYDEISIDNRFPLSTGHPFENLDAPYWTSTTAEGVWGEAERAFMIFGILDVLRVDKTGVVFVWPVRGGN